MSTDLFEKLFLQMVSQMMISIDLMMIDWILLHLFIKNCVLDRLGNSFGRYVYWLYDFEGGYVNTKIYKIFKTAAGRPADGKVGSKDKISESAMIFDYLSNTCFRLRSLEV